MSDVLTVAGRFNGPLESGNGGYVAGLLAAHLGGPAAVSLRSPVPLDRELELVRDGEDLRLLDGETTIAEATPAPPLDLELPATVSLEQAREASSRYAAPDHGPFSQCFVCGPARADCFEVFAGPLAGTEMVATTWTPPAWTGGPEGDVRPEFVWATLDCPTYFAAYGGEMALAFLVRQQVELRAPVAAGVEHVVVAWPLGGEGRKRTAAAAVLAAGGEVLALGEALLVEPRGG